ncbi:hypothetical protein Aoki45_31200 [Algoriphagus sp. oki45]|uniref:hypothetical protein n=1 Tax=Algoriphagus sp. oki45 TaxID=3067294 RepID=UPI0027F941CE|nr:hypothetical protein Aoki45_31200 [Algoriphagus sp. oki45]
MALLTNIHVRFWLFSLGLGLIIWVLQQVFPAIIHPKIWEILIFLVLFFFFIQLLNSFLLKMLPDSFFQISVLAMVLRLVGSLVFIGVEVWPGMENIILFIADFFVIFLFYLVFDIYAFLSNLRPISK